MRIPRIFVPEKSLDYKTEEMSFYKEISDKLKDELKVFWLNLYSYPYPAWKVPARILWISDTYQKSRYKYIEKIVAETVAEAGITEQGNTPNYDIYDYYAKEFERRDVCVMADKLTFANLTQIIYKDHKPKEELTKKECAPLFQRSNIILI